MRKLILSAIALFAMALALPAFASEPAVPADGLKMAKTKMEVTFNHSTHKEIKCADCHHPVDGKADFKPCASAGCHDVFDKKDKSEKSYYKVMHGKNLKYATCVSCHSDYVKTKPEMKKELTGCKGSKCHPS